MGVIILSAYLAGIIYWTINTRRIWKEIGNDPWRIIGVILGMCIWPVWMIGGFIRGFKEEMEKDK